MAHGKRASLLLPLLESENEAGRGAHAATCLACVAYELQESAVETSNRSSAAGSGLRVCNELPSAVYRALHTPGLLEVFTAYYPAALRSILDILTALCDDDNLRAQAEGLLPGILRLRQHKRSSSAIQCDAYWVTHPTAADFAARMAGDSDAALVLQQGGMWEDIMILAAGLSMVLRSAREQQQPMDPALAVPVANRLRFLLKAADDIFGRREHTLRPCKDAAAAVAAVAVELTACCCVDVYSGTSDAGPAFAQAAVACKHMLGAAVLCLPVGHWTNFLDNLAGIAGSFAVVLDDLAAGKLHMQMRSGHLATSLMALSMTAVPALARCGKDTHAASVAHEAEICTKTARVCWLLASQEGLYTKPAAVTLGCNDMELATVGHQAEAAVLLLSEHLVARLDAMLPRTLLAERLAAQLEAFMPQKKPQAACSGVDDAGAAGAVLEAGCPLLRCLVMYHAELQHTEDSRVRPRQLSTGHSDFGIRAAQLLLRAASIAAAMAEPPPSAELVLILGRALGQVPVLFGDELAGTDCQAVNATAEMASMLAPLMPRVQDSKLLEIAAVRLLNNIVYGLEGRMWSLQYASAKTKCHWFCETAAALQRMVTHDAERLRGLLTAGVSAGEHLHPPWPVLRQCLQRLPIMRSPELHKGRQALAALDAVISGKVASQQHAPSDDSAAAAAADAAAAALLQVRVYAGLT